MAEMSAIASLSRLIALVRSPNPSSTHSAETATTALLSRLLTLMRAPSASIEERDDCPWCIWPAASLAFVIAVAAVLQLMQRHAAGRASDVSSSSECKSKPAKASRGSGTPPPHWANIQGSWVVGGTEGDTDGLLKLMGYPSVVRTSLSLMRYGVGISKLDIELYGPYSIKITNDAGTPLAMANKLEINGKEQAFVGNEGLPGNDKYSVSMWWEGEAMMCAACARPASPASELV